ncbi:MAG: hypothetical protein AUI36_04230 [Cyanobacteria bacterium 13_1_40CM_2_61_4]|nr:MAG: hypothetical protein AUI36_04230 [Cyanobacteria bacterium 13_1_40CM_2_61_4]
MRRFSFVQLGLFTSRPLEGNPLAAFSDGRGLTEREMQALAREDESLADDPRSPRRPVCGTEAGNDGTVPKVVPSLV